MHYRYYLKYKMSKIFIYFILIFFFSMIKFLLLYLFFVFNFIHFSIN